MCPLSLQVKIGHMRHVMRNKFFLAEEGVSRPQGHLLSSMASHRTGASQETLGRSSGSGVPSSRAQRAGADPSAVRPCGRSFKTPGQRLWAGSFVSHQKKLEGSTIGAGVQSLAEGSSPWDRASVMQASFSMTTLGRPYRAGSAKRPKDEPQKSLTLFESLRRSGFVQSIGTGLSQAVSRRVGPLLPCLTPDAEERQCLPFFLCASGQGQRGRVLRARQLRAALVCKTQPKASRVCASSLLSHLLLLLLLPSHLSPSSLSPSAVPKPERAGKVTLPFVWVSVSSYCCCNMLTMASPRSELTRRFSSGRSLERNDSRSILKREHSLGFPLVYGCTVYGHVLMMCFRRCVSHIPVHVTERRRFRNRFLWNYGSGEQASLGQELVKSGV